MKFGSQQCSIELSVVVVFNDDSSHWHTFHQTAAATSAQINFTISTACTTKIIRDSLMECVQLDLSSLCTTTTLSSMLYCREPNFNWWTPTFLATFLSWENQSAMISFHQTAAATSAQINFTISTACTTKSEIGQSWGSTTSQLIKTAHLKKNHEINSGELILGRSKPFWTAVQSRAERK